MQPQPNQDKNSYQLGDWSAAWAEGQAFSDRAQGWHVLIGGLIARADGRLFSQRRSLTRRFGPGLWDNVGGHLEGDETLAQCLAREVFEETGWHLTAITKVIAVRTWFDDRGRSQEYIVLANVSGDLERPVLEPDKVDQSTWIGLDNVELLSQGREDDPSQTAIYRHALTLSS